MSNKDLFDLFDLTDWLFDLVWFDLIVGQKSDSAGEGVGGRGAGV